MFCISGPFNNYLLEEFCFLFAAVSSNFFGNLSTFFVGILAIYFANKQNQINNKLYELQNNTGLGIFIKDDGTFRIINIGSKPVIIHKIIVSFPESISTEKYTLEEDQFLVPVSNYTDSWVIVNLGLFLNKVLRARDVVEISKNPIRVSISYTETSVQKSRNESFLICPEKSYLREATKIIDSNEINFYIGDSAKHWIVSTLDK